VIQAIGLLVIVGHDTNISNIAGMLGIDWLLSGYQPRRHTTGECPGIRLWQQGEGEMVVSTTMSRKALEQMRRHFPLRWNRHP